MQLKPEESLTRLDQAEVVSRPSNSRIAEAYRTKNFIDSSANDIQFHVARNLLFLRRYRRISQAKLAQAVGTSQSAIARIETAQENITLDTLRRIVVALKGRLHVSFPPTELEQYSVQPWWEAAQAANTSTPPTVIRSAVRLDPDGAEQALAGLHRTCEKSVLHADTTPMRVLLAASGTLAASETRE